MKKKNTKKHKNGKYFSLNLKKKKWKTERKKSNFKYPIYSLISTQTKTKINRHTSNWEVYVWLYVCGTYIGHES